MPGKRKGKGRKKEGEEGEGREGRKVRTPPPSIPANAPGPSLFGPNFHFYRAAWNADAV